MFGINLQDLYDKVEPYLTRENLLTTLAVLAVLQLIWIKIHLGTIRRKLTGEKPGFRLRMLARMRMILGRAPLRDPASGQMVRGRTRRSSDIDQAARDLARNSPRQPSQPGDTMSSR